MSHNMHGEVRGHLEVFWWFLPLGRGDWIQLVKQTHLWAVLWGSVSL